MVTSVHATMQHLALVPTTGLLVVLGNGVCLVGYTIALWRFFRDRIEKEERFLVRFFGEEYLRYRERTVVGIPFL